MALPRASVPSLPEAVPAIDVATLLGLERDLVLAPTGTAYDLEPGARRTVSSSAAVATPAATSVPARPPACPARGSSAPTPRLALLPAGLASLRLVGEL